MNKMVKAPSKVTMLIVALLVSVLSACGGSTGDLALNAVYGFKSANKTKVPDQLPAGYAEATLQVQVKDQVNSTHLWHYNNVSNPTAPVILYFHGNAENIGTLYKYGFMKQLESFGNHFVIMDYPSYGKSTGTPSMESVMAAVDATIAWTQAQYPQSKIVVWGWSLGAAVAAQTATRPAISRFVLTSPWTNVKEMAKQLAGSFAGLIPKEFYEANKWDSVEAAKVTTTKGLIFHGEDDDLIPVSMGEKVAGSYPAGQIEFFRLPGRDHGGVFSEAGLWATVKTFLNQ